LESYKFNLNPKEVPEIKTSHRCIKTKIPAPESLKILEKIKKYESSNVMDQLPVIWDRASGYNIFDPYGNCWIDFTSTIFVTNAGHGSSHIIKRINEWISKPLLHSYSYATRIRADYIEKLIQMTPSYLDKVSLFSGGTEASERAIKLARKYGQKFTPNRKIIIGGEGNYHGKTLGAQMAGGQEDGKHWIGNLDPDMVQMPFPYPWVLEKTGKSGEALFFDHLSELESKGVNLKNIASFIVESFQGWAAVFYPKDYIKAMRKWSNENESLLIFDEIQAGFGRSGKLFSYEHYDVKPDLVICGKAISSSFPLSAVLGRAEIIELDPTYTSTHGGHPLACAAGLGNLEAFEKENLISESKRKEDIIRKEISNWKTKFPNRIGYIFGYGMIFGVFITHEDSDERDFYMTDQIVERAMEKGVFSIRTGLGTIKLGPPLTIPDEALIEGLRVYEECFDELF